MLARRRFVTVRQIFTTIFPAAAAAAALPLFIFAPKGIKSDGRTRSCRRPLHSTDLTDQTCAAQHRLVGPEDFERTDDSDNGRRSSCWNLV